MNRKIAKALSTTRNWPRIKQALRALSDAELAEAEEIERLGRRRSNMMMALKAERNLRAGKPEKMLRLRVEVSE